MFWAVKRKNKAKIHLQAQTQNSFKTKAELTLYKRAETTH